MVAALGLARPSDMGLVDSKWYPDAPHSHVDACSMASSYSIARWRETVNVEVTSQCQCRIEVDTGFRSSFPIKIMLHVFVYSIV